MILLSVESFYSAHEGTIQIIAIAFGILVGYFSIVKPLYDYIKSKKNERKYKRFLTYHKLIDILVGKDGTAMVDRQIVIVYELRNFPEYFRVTKRILMGLKADWEGPQTTVPRLVAEIEITLEYIDASHFTRVFCFNK